MGMYPGGNVIRVTPTLSTDAYAANDVIFNDHQNRFVKFLLGNPVEFFTDNSEFARKTYNESLGGQIYQMIHGNPKYTVEDDTKDPWYEEIGQFFVGLLNPVDIAMFALSSGAGNLAAKGVMKGGLGIAVRASALRGTQKMIKDQGVKYALRHHGVMQIGKTMALTGGVEMGVGLGTLGMSSSVLHDAAMQRTQMRQTQEYGGYTDPETGQFAQKTDFDYWQNIYTGVSGGLSSSMIGFATGGIVKGVMAPRFAEAQRLYKGGNNSFMNTTKLLANNPASQFAAEVSIFTAGGVVDSLVAGHTVSWESTADMFVHNLGIIGGFKAFGGAQKSFNNYLAEKGVRNWRGNPIEKSKGDFDAYIKQRKWFVKNVIFPEFKNLKQDYWNLDGKPTKKEVTDAQLGYVYGTNAAGQPIIPKGKTKEELKKKLGEGATYNRTNIERFGKEYEMRPSDVINQINPELYKPKAMEFDPVTGKARGIGKAGWYTKEEIQEFEEVMQLHMQIKTLKNVADKALMNKDFESYNTLMDELLSVEKLYANEIGMLTDYQNMSSRYNELLKKSLKEDLTPKENAEMLALMTTLNQVTYDMITKDFLVDGKITDKGKEWFAGLFNNEKGKRKTSAELTESEIALLEGGLNAKLEQHGLLSNSYNDLSGKNSEVINSSLYSLDFRSTVTKNKDNTYSIDIISPDGINLETATFKKLRNTKYKTKKAAQKVADELLNAVRKTIQKPDVVAVQETRKRISSAKKKKKEIETELEEIYSKLGKKITDK